MLKTEVIEPKKPATASVILLHGLGANGYDLMDLLSMMRLPQDHTIRFVFPHAPARPVTINGGVSMPAWYDITGFSFDSREDLSGLEASRFIVDTLIQEEISKGISPKRVILGGFSQGGALSLFTGLQLAYPLAGLMVLSAYFPCAKHVMAHLGVYAKQIPVFMAHGTEDPIVNCQWGEATKKHLQAEGFSVEWHTYPMAHAICEEEVQRMKTFIQSSFL